MLLQPGQRFKKQSTNFLCICHCQSFSPFLPYHTLIFLVFQLGDEVVERNNMGHNKELEEEILEVNDAWGQNKEKVHFAYVEHNKKKVAT